MLKGPKRTTRGEEDRLFLCSGRRRVSVHANPPRVTQLRDAETWTVAGGHDRYVRDTDSSRVWSIDDIRPWLDGQPRSTRGRADTDAESPR